MKSPNSQSKQAPELAAYFRMSPGFGRLLWRSIQSFMNTSSSTSGTPWLLSSSELMCPTCPPDMYERASCSCCSNAYTTAPASAAARAAQLPAWPSPMTRTSHWASSATSSGAEGGVLHDAAPEAAAEPPDAPDALSAAAVGLHAASPAPAATTAAVAPSPRKERRVSLAFESFASSMIAPLTVCHLQHGQQPGNRTNKGGVGGRPVSRLLAMPLWHESMPCQRQRR